MAGELDGMLLGSAVLKVLLAVTLGLALICAIGVMIVLILNGIRELYLSWEELKWQIKHSKNEESELNRLTKESAQY